MNGIGFFAIGVGAALGAWMRWVLGIWLNPVVVNVPMGTLASNLIGGYLVGAAIAVFHLHVELSPELRLFIITGFLGGLTTFSSFSAEVVALIQRAEWGWAIGAVGLHVGGSLLMTLFGIWTIQRLAA